MPDFTLKDRFLSPNGLHAYCRMRDYAGMTEDHRHSHEAFEEVVIVCSGSGVHVTEEGSYPIGPGDVFLIPEGRFHGYGELRNLRIANLIFHRAELERTGGELVGMPGYDMLFRNGGRLNEKFRFGNRLTLAGKELARCEELCCRMVAEQGERLAGSAALIWGYFVEICVIACRSFATAGENRCREIGDLCELLRYMNAHHGDGRLGLRQLAARVNRSVSSLTRMFRQGLEKSPMEYLNTIRLESAARELRETEERISEIALRHGFSDSNYFSSCFSARFGMSPRAYRGKARK